LNLSGLPAFNGSDLEGFAVAGKIYYRKIFMKSTAETWFLFLIVLLPSE